MKLKETGVEFAQNKTGLTASGPRKPESVPVTTRPYPVFPTDMQAQFMALMCVSQDTSLIQETIFENLHLKGRTTDN